MPQGLVVRFGLGLKSNQTKSGPVVATAASSLLLLHCIIIASATAAAEKVWAVLAARGTVIVVIVGRGSPPAARTPPRRRRPHDEVAGSPWRQGWGVGVLDLDLVTYCAVNWLTIAQARRQTEMHSGRQRAEV